MSRSLKVRSRVGDYEVRFIDGFTSTLKHYAKRDSFLVVDRKVLRLYRKEICEAFPKKRIFPVDARENNKTIEYCYGMVRRLIENKIRRDYVLVAMGGGIIQDITAFISSILFRGIEWVFYPTTLLAQADSCIGSKSSINVDEFKNLLGTFYPPSKIFIDMNFLKTLPPDAIRSGIGEMLHFYFIAGSELAERLTDDYERFIHSPALLRKYIFSSLCIKKDVIEVDEFDRDKRNVFNYGHTFGHAIESVSGYKVSHGEAVTMGMDIANFISLRMGHLDPAAFESMHRILAKNMPDFKMDKDRLGRYLTALSKDKKNIRGDLVCIIARRPGSMQKVRIRMDGKFKRFLSDYFKVWQKI